MVDADGATKFADLERLEKRLLQVRAIAFCSCEEASLKDSAHLLRAVVNIG